MEARKHYHASAAGDNTAATGKQYCITAGKNASGDMPPLQNTTSSTALSPPFTSPTASHVGFRMSTHVEQPQQSDITSVLDSELDSILTFSSYNWEQTTQQPLHAGWPQHGTFQGDVSNLPQEVGPWKQENTATQVTHVQHCHGLSSGFSGFLSIPYSQWDHVGFPSVFHTVPLRGPSPASQPIPSQ